MIEMIVNQLIQEMSEKMRPDTLGEGLKLLIANGVRAIDGESDQQILQNTMKEKETESMQFSISENEFQIMIASSNNFYRIKVKKLGKDNFKAILEKDLLDRTLDVQGIKKVKDAIESLHRKKIPVVGFLGGVRAVKPEHVIPCANQTLYELIKCSVGEHPQNHVAVLTAGYRGNVGDDTESSYGGSTRAAHDATKLFMHKEGEGDGILYPMYATSLVVSPEVGKWVCHENPSAIDFYGETWGDDTPALIGAGDAFVVFAPYGLITELEMATALMHNKPIVIINTDPSNKDIQPKSDYFRHKDPITEATPSVAASFIKAKIPWFESQHQLTPVSGTHFLKKQNSVANYHIGATTPGWALKMTNSQYALQFNQRGTTLDKEHVMTDNTNSKVKKDNHSND